MSVSGRNTSQLKDNCTLVNYDLQWFGAIENALGIASFENI